MKTFKWLITGLLILISSGCELKGAVISEENAYDKALLAFLPNDGQQHLTVQYRINDTFDYEIIFNPLAEAEKLPQVGYFMNGVSNVSGEDYEKYVSYQVANEYLVLNRFDALINVDLYHPVDVISRGGLNLGASNGVMDEGEFIWEIGFGEELISLGLSSSVTDIIMDSKSHDLKSYTLVYQFEDENLKACGYLNGMYEERLMFEKGIGLKSLQFNVPVTDEQPDFIKENDYYVDVEFVKIK